MNRRGLVSSQDDLKSRNLTDLERNPNVCCHSNLAAYYNLYLENAISFALTEIYDLAANRCVSVVSALKAAGSFNRASSYAALIDAQLAISHA